MNSRRPLGKSGGRGEVGIWVILVCKGLCGQEYLGGDRCFGMNTWTYCDEIERLRLVISPGRLRTLRDTPPFDLLGGTHARERGSFQEASFMQCNIPHEGKRRNGERRGEGRGL